MPKMNYNPYLKENDSRNHFCNNILTVIIWICFTGILNILPNNHLLNRLRINILVGRQVFCIINAGLKTKNQLKNP
jgi:hypothetical protein